MIRQSFKLPSSNRSLFSNLNALLNMRSSEGEKKTKKENEKPNATRRGATHKQGKVFKSRNISGCTPAEYRRRHLGRVSQRWVRKGMVKDNGS